MSLAARERAALGEGSRVEVAVGRGPDGVGVGRTLVGEPNGLGVSETGDGVLWTIGLGEESGVVVGKLTSSGPPQAVNPNKVTKQTESNPIR